MIDKEIFSAVRIVIDGKMAILENTTHFKHVQSNIREITMMLPVCFLILLLILIYTKNSTFDKTIIITILVAQAIAYIVCKYLWNQHCLVLTHYIYIASLFVVLLSNNPFLILYLFLILLYNIYVWIRFGGCIFGGLEWFGFISDFTGKAIVYGLTLLYLLKFILLSHGKSM